MNYIDENSKIWDKLADDANRWTVPVTSEQIEMARKDEWSIVLTPTKPIPREWFPKSMKGIKILCLASGGGQQGPILAATGADVTVFDNSRNQLEKDEYVATREKLDLQLVQGNMQDLSMFADESFDYIVHPWSNAFVNDVRVVWRECARVLKKNGVLLAGFGNPVEYIFNVGKLDEGILEVTNKLPYADIEHLDDPKTKEIATREGFIWSHTLEDQIQGQIEAGFALVGFYEDRSGTVLDQYMNGSIATKAVKL